MHYKTDAGTLVVKIVKKSILNNAFLTAKWTRNLSFGLPFFTLEWGGGATYFHVLSIILDLLVPKRNILIVFKSDIMYVIFF